MPDAPAGVVGVRAPGHHGDDGEEEWYGGEEADPQRSLPIGLDHLRHPETHAVEADDDAEIKEAQHEHARPRQRLAELGIAGFSRGFGLGRERASERRPLFLTEPTGVLGPVVEKFERDHAEDDRRQALDDEQPMPALQAEQSMHLEQRARDRASDHGGKRHRRHEQRDDARAFPRRKPISEIEDDAREEAGFGDAQQEAQRIEAPLAADKGDGDQAPADHDARSRCARRISASPDCSAPRTGYSRRRRCRRRRRTPTG
jgi:hypothetical protein